MSSRPVRRRPGQHQQPLWRLAHFDAPGAFPPAGKETCAELTAQAQVALYLAEPAREPAGVGECGPQVVDIGVEAILKTDDARAVALRRVPRMRMPPGVLVVIGCSFVHAFRGRLGVQGIQPLFPQGPVSTQPFVDLGERLGRRQ